MLRHVFTSSLMALMLAGASAGPVRAAPELLSIELNRLEQVAEGCRFDLVIENASEVAFARLSTEFVMFDRGGVISARATTHFGRLRPNKTHVRSFVFPAIDCADVGRVLLSEVVACEHAGPSDLDCMDAIEVSHRGGVALIK